MQEQLNLFRPREGITYLDVERSRDSTLTFSFASRGGGADDWDKLVDGFETAISRLPELGVDDGVVRIDGWRLGQGARIEMDRAVFYLVFGMWVEDPVVAAALDRLSLQLRKGDALEPGWSDDARRFLAHVRASLSNVEAHQ